MASCDICVTPFNKTTRCKIKCPLSDCGKEACFDCYQRFLVERPLPMCMHCGNMWSRPQLYETNLPSKFINGPMTNQYKRNMLLQARSELPQIHEMKIEYENIRRQEIEYLRELEEVKTLMTITNFQKEDERDKEKKKEMNKIIKQARPKKKRLEKRLERLKYSLPRILQGNRAFSLQDLDLKEMMEDLDRQRPDPELYARARALCDHLLLFVPENLNAFPQFTDGFIETCDRDLERVRVNLTKEEEPDGASQFPEGVPDGASQFPEQPSSKKKKIRLCFLDGCKGLLLKENKIYTCSTCQKRVCLKCEKERGDEHECDENDVQTVELLKRDTKNCPRCTVPIHRCEGCPQMWCTRCHTAFDWHSLRIQNGYIHNPHYFEWQRENRADQPEDEDETLQRRPYNYERILRRLRGIDYDQNLIERIYRTVGHYGQSRRWNNHFTRGTDRFKILFDWINGSPDEKVADELFKLNKEEERVATRRDLDEMYYTLGGRAIQALTQGRTPEDVSLFIQTMTDLRQKYNEKSAILRKAYRSVKFVQIPDDWSCIRI